MVNGKVSWNSAANAIWYSQGLWLIEHKDFVGTMTAAIVSEFGNQCPFNLLSEMWYYADYANNAWEKSSPNKINVYCF